MTSKCTTTTIVDITGRNDASAGEGIIDKPLNDRWILWRHDLAAPGVKWDMASYEKVAEVSTVHEYWELMNSIGSINTSMWFFMRSSVPPRWEDKRNRKGGSFKFKISQATSNSDWVLLCTRLVGESLCKDPKDSEYISGCTLSPKGREWTTISIWNLDCSRISSAEFPTNIPHLDFSKSRIEPHAKRRIG